MNRVSSLRWFQELTVTNLARMGLKDRQTPLVRIIRSSRTVTLDSNIKNLSVDRVRAASPRT